MAKYNAEEQRERGVRFALRAGLDPATTNIEWTYEPVDRGDPDKQVLVKLETFLFLTREEFAAIYNGE